MKFKELVTETYDIRPKTIEILEDFGFKKKLHLEKHIKINEKFVDSFIFILENK